MRRPTFSRDAVVTFVRLRARGCQRCAASLLVATLIAGWVAEAGAFRTGADLPQLGTQSAVAWQDERVQFLVGGATPADYPVVDLVPTVSRALQTWSNASCGAASLGVVNGLGVEAVHGDGLNTIAFIEEDWSSVGPEDAAAATDIVYEKEGDDVRIVEADIYINAQEFSWAPRESGAKNLEAVLLHEIGHALGLLHPCEPGGDAEGAPDCASEAAFADAAMYPLYHSGALALGDDDRAGLCHLYGCEPTCQATAEQKLAEVFRCETVDDCSKETCAATPVCKLDRPAGDECDEDRQCTTGECKNRQCVVLVCDGDDSPDACPETDLASFGESCTRGDDCVSRNCLLGATTTPICTRTCDPADSSSCPEGYACENVDGDFACAPPSPLAVGGGGGCAVISSSATTSTHRIALFALLLLATQRRRSLSQSREQQR